MATDELRKRAVWQDLSGQSAVLAERSFPDIFTEEFKGSTFRIRARPREFKDLYSKVELAPENLAQLGVYPQPGQGPSPNSPSPRSVPARRARFVTESETWT
jgi:hypothetical protein